MKMDVVWVEDDKLRLDEDDGHTTDEEPPEHNFVPGSPMAGPSQDDQPPHRQRQLHLNEDDD